MRPSVGVPIILFALGVFAAVGLDAMHHHTTPVRLNASQHGSPTTTEILSDLPAQFGDTPTVTTMALSDLMPSPGPAAGSSHPASGSDNTPTTRNREDRPERTSTTPAPTADTTPNTTPATAVDCARTPSDPRCGSTDTTRRRTTTTEPDDQSGNPDEDTTKTTESYPF